jgi:hypothetical protein
MESLFTDVILFISNNYLEKDKDKLSFLSCVTFWHTLKSKVHFQEETSYNQRLESLFYYKNLNIRYHMFDYNFKSIPEHTKVLNFGLYFNHPLKKGDIPNSVTTLICGLYFNQPLKKGDIPNFITTLRFGNCFNQPLEKGDIPDSVTTLEFGFCFDQPLKKGNIPDSVTTLTLGNYFNQPLKPGDIPNSVITLTFGDYFNQTLKPGDIPNRPLSSDIVPNSVKEIVLTNYYTLRIPDPFLNRVTYK